jgi:hypothetical protein
MLSTALRASLFVTLSVAAIAACGGSAPPATTPAAGSAAPTDTSAPTAPSAAATPAPAAGGGDATAAAVPTTWTNDMAKPQQVAFMKANVVPSMGPLFKTHDASKYGDFGCKTCHGSGQNPHDFLPHLTFTGGSMKECKDKPDVCKWMHESVEPAMAKSMGAQPYDMKTNTGFGCKGCHTVDMK